MDAYLAIAPNVDQITWTPKDLNGNPVQGLPSKTVPVWDFLQFLKRPRSPVPIFMFLDDVYGWLASYFFGSDFNKTAFRLLAAGRKKNINIAESSVRFKDVDPRLRALHSHLFVPKFNAEYEIVALERYLVDAFEDRRLYPDMYYEATRYYNAYDTNEVIESVYDSPKGKESVRAIGAVQITDSGQVIMARGPGDKHPAPTEIKPTAIYSNPVSIPPTTPKTTLPPTTPNGRKEPNGYEAIANGMIVQNDIARQYQTQGYFTRLGWMRNEPDIIVYQDAEQTKPLKVVSVKSFWLVASKDRWSSNSVAPFSSVGGGVEGVGAEQEEASVEGGIGGKKKKASGTVARVIYREGVEPELQAARLLNNVPCELVIVNLRNGRSERVLLQPDFQKYTTSQALNED
jgi:hypothetical protein